LKTASNPGGFLFFQILNRKGCGIIGIPIWPTKKNVKNAVSRLKAKRIAALATIRFAVSAAIAQMIAAAAVNKNKYSVR